MGVGYCHHNSPISFFGCFNLITGIVPSTFRRYISTSCSPELSVYRLFSRRALAMSGEGSLSEGRAYLLTLHPSLIPSTIRTLRPNLPRLSVGGGRTRPGSRVAHVGRSGPYTSIGRPGFRLTTAGPCRLMCISRRSPLVAYPDHSKGVVPSRYVESNSVLTPDDYGTTSAVSPTKRGAPRTYVFFYFISLLVDGPQRYHPACGH